MDIEKRNFGSRLRT